MSEAVGLYVHLPWCARKCPYCDFNSHVVAGALPEARYVDALLADLARELRDWPAPRVASVFIGGGTPSLFGAAAIARLLDGVAARLTLAGDCEITLEANPGSSEAGRFAGYRAAGVNRLSLGIQSFDDAALAALGRVHDGAAARAAIGAARAAGFDNLNLDLMFGLPGVVPETALTDLARAIAYGPEHVSWYQLTLEEGTAFARKPPPLPAHDDIADVHDAGLAALAAAGYRHYEISAHARAGRAARHNLNYWQFGDYLGIGAGAHGKQSVAAGVRRRVRVRSPARYLECALAGDAIDTETLTTGADCVVEYALNALRLADGFRLEDFERRTGLSAADPAFAGPLAAAEARGWLERRDGRVAPTAAGFRFLTDLQLLFVDAEPAVATPAIA
ncbi:MAG: radical SAM family heme chaperone HemW [Gammaproteobacteria bacterium]|nr:radical SAM family heme chaperone HemW [Gammaproteobacteria bacterium]